MRLLYVGELGSGALAEHRRRILAELGHQIISVNNHINCNRITPAAVLYRTTLKLGYPLDLNGVNQRLRKICATEKIDLVWIDKGWNIYPRTIRAIKKLLPRAPVINLNPDNPFGLKARGWGWFKQCIPLYDYCFVPREASVRDYLQAGAPRVKRFYWGYVPGLHRPLPVSPADRAQLGGPVGFIGTFEKERGHAIQELAQSGVPVRVWGNGWGPWKDRLSHLKIEGKGVWESQFSRAICSFDLNLGFLNKQNLDTLNTRCLAIPACGGFLLAERGGDLPGLFKEGHEAEFFESAEELIDKVRFYQKNDHLRKKVAEAGRERCLRDNYSATARLKEIVSTVSDIM